MALNIFEPLKFRTQGIEDLATQDTLVVSNGKITVDTVEAKKAVAFAGANFAEVEGKGIKWTDGRKSKTLALKQNALWTDLTLNLAEEQVYQINDVPVLSFTELGNTVTKSNLKQVGTLRSLDVSGNALLGDFAFFNSDFNRVGINTDAPALALGLVENGVTIAIGSQKSSTATIGTINNTHLELVTDNTARITINNAGDVRVHGKLYVEEIITDKLSPLVFKEKTDSNIYGKGIVWSPLKGKQSQFVFQPNPDRIWSTNNIDLDAEKYYSIENTMVLSKTSLGSTVVESNLTKIGILKELIVAGDAAVTRKISTSRLEIGRFAVDENRLEYTNEFNLQTNNVSEFKLGQDIVIGNVNNLNRPVSVYGQLTVGVARPDEDVALTVAGSVSFDNKKFKVGSGIPTSGHFNKGDIVWNSDPKPTGYIGWVCITPGTPGAWLPFGAIAK